MNNNEDTRGYDLKADNFKNQLLSAINNCNLSVSTAYYIVKDMCNTLEKMFDKAASEQYKKFCEETNKARLAKQEAKETTSQESNKKR